MACSMGRRFTGALSFTVQNVAANYLSSQIIHAAALHSARPSHSKRTSMRQLLHAFLLASFITTAGAADLPTAKPESVGFSSQRLDRITKEMQTLTDKGVLPGVVTMAAR